MKRIFILLLSFIAYSLEAQVYCNSDFETGTKNQWGGSTGNTNGWFNPMPDGPVSCCYIDSLVTTTSTVGTMCTNGIDNYGGFPIVSPNGGSYSLLLGNDTGGFKIESVAQGFNITPNSKGYTFRIAAVVQDRGGLHNDSTKPYFGIRMYGGASNFMFLTYLLDDDSLLTGWQTSSVDSTVRYLPWTEVTFDLSTVIQMFSGGSGSVTFFTNDCANHGNHFAYAYIDGVCDQDPYRITDSGPVCNAGDTITLTGPPGMKVYNWSGPVSANSRVLKTNIPGTYTLSTLSYFDYPPTQNLYYNFLVDSIAPSFSTTTVCQGNLTYFTNATSGSSNTYKWDFGDGKPDSLMQNTAHIYDTAGVFNATLIVSNGCGVSDSITKQVMVYKLPSIGVTSSPTVCTGQHIGFCDTIAGYPSYVWNAPPMTGGFYTPTACCSFSSAIGWMNGKWTITVTDTNQCVKTDTCLVTILPLDSCSLVWPGDANNDLIADGNDIILIGLANGQTGSPRANASLNWVGQTCPFWTNSTPYNNMSYFINNKHVDCDGNGSVDLNDTLGVIQNFSLVHPSLRNANDEILTGSIPLTLIPQQNLVAPGGTVTLDVVLGSNTNPASNFYGITMSQLIDTSQINTNSIRLNANGSWLGALNSNLIAVTLKKNDLAQLVFSKTNQNVVSGYGKIGEIKYQVLNTVSDGTTLNFGINNANLVNSAFSTIPVDLSGTIITVTVSTNIDVNEINYINLFIFPNPTTGGFGIEAQGKITQLKITNLIGEEVKDFPIKTQGSKTEIDLSAVPNGIYFVKVKTSDGESTKKIIVQH